MLYAQCADVTHVHSFLLKRQPRVAARPTRIGKTDRKVLHSWSSVTTGTPTVSGCRPCANAHLKIRWGPQAAAFEAKSGHGSEDNLFKDADEPIGVHESEPIILPDALPIALVDESLIIGCDSLFDMLLGTTSGLVSKFLQIRACHSISLGNWTNTGGQKQRLVSYTVPVKKNALGPSEAACIEQYTVNSKQAGSWLVTLLVHTPKVPFGDTFHQQLQWACQQEGSGRCRLRVTGQVNFTKACFVKGIIQKASEEGMKEAYQLYTRILKEELAEQ
ncbi:TPA: hypothetical protein ACH3X2_009289 [Trebouxia sp. C0005]